MPAITRSLWLDANPERASAAMGAISSMGTIDLAAIEAAADAVTSA
jgi:hypothetical protein